MEVCCDREMLLRPEPYRDAFEGYTVPPRVLEVLQSIRERTTLFVVLGYWCPDSQRIVPGVLRAEKDAENPNLNLLAVTVTYAETDHLPVDIGCFSVRCFPTVIFVRGRHEVVESPAAEDEIIRFVEEPIDPERLAAALGV